MGVGTSDALIIKYSKMLRGMVDMDIFLFALFMTLANIIQGITGFAGAPLAMPPCIAVVGITNAKSAITFIFWFTSLVVTLKNLKKIDYKHLGIMLAFMIPGVVAGMWLFKQLPLNILMLIYGVVIILIAVKKLFFPAKKPLPGFMGYVVLVLAGLMQGMFTSGGPFMALYAADAIKDKTVFRPTVTTVWTVLNSYMIVQMYADGMYSAMSYKLIAFTVIPVFVAIYIGRILNGKMKQDTFLKLVYCLLIVSGSLLIYNYIKL